MFVLLVLHEIEHRLPRHVVGTAINCICIASLAPVSFWYNVTGTDWAVSDVHLFRRVTFLITYYICGCMNTHAIGQQDSAAQGNCYNLLVVKTVTVISKWHA